MYSRLLALVVVLLCCSTVRADLILSLSYTAQAQSDLSESQREMFAAALGYWDSVIVGYRDNVSRSWNLSVDTFQQAAVGGNVLLGSGSYSGLGLTNVVADAQTSDGRFYISTGGTATFNIHPDAGPLSEVVIRHEIAHALGFGSLWELNQVYNDGVTGNSFRTLQGGQPGQYVGSAALEAYRSEFAGQAGATFVPVELSGGIGTAHGHWDESDDAGQSLTGIVDTRGRDFRDELMTGWAGSASEAFVSSTTIAAFADIGFTVNAIPEPSSVVVLSLAAMLASAAPRRRGPSTT